MENKKVAIRGIVKRRLYDKDGNPVRMFQENRFWEFLNGAFKWDVKIPFITGRWTLDPIVHNDITNTGLARIAGLIVGALVSEAAIDPFTYLAIGISTATSSGLGSEITTGGGARAAGQISTVQTTIANDTAQIVKEWEFSDSFAITEEGWFNASSGGDLLAFRNFSAVNVESGNKFEVTHQIVVAEDTE
jgi:hypothetical protein